MQILIVTHAPRGSTKGNRITADRWARFLTQAGHSTRIENGLVEGQFDRLLALHATHSSDAIARFQQVFPDRPVILCLTGTDLHRDLQGKRGEQAKRIAADSIRRCSKLVLLEPEGIRHLPSEAVTKAHVVLQSAVAVSKELRTASSTGATDLCVIGHLRDEKDPFLAARASRRLPANSRIRITHIGAALNPEIGDAAREQMRTAHRYQWIGPFSHAQTQQRLASSNAMLLTSKIEGAPSVISEAVVNSVPILCTRIPATIGLLGSDYRGMFAVGDEVALASDMSRLENDASFALELTVAVKALAFKFQPAVEQAALENLIR
ncbi:selenoneine biosynthesis selenosugar synthase SenB [Planctomycetes bacterium K23_9]|uniref:Glycosyl transferases group 1 n=1 Tax=Stieleria marina TaxID=1930275 RepID=A0A517NT77_9BACT|nr:Glycosyl transferases group 1 [Planctomycetes bacterium K23_9]